MLLCTFEFTDNCTTYILLMNLVMLNEKIITDAIVLQLDMCCSAVALWELYEYIILLL